MNSSLSELKVAKAQNVVATEDTLTVDFTDGRSVSAPVGWYPRLSHGTLEEPNKWRLIGDGKGIHWPDLDEDLSKETAQIDAQPPLIGTTVQYRIP